MTSLLKYGVLLTPKYGQKCKFLRVTQNLRGFAYIARRYNSAAEATSLLSSVASLAKKQKQTKSKTLTAPLVILRVTHMTVLTGDSSPGVLSPGS